MMRTSRKLSISIVFTVLLGCLAAEVDAQRVRGAIEGAAKRAASKKTQKGPEHATVFQWLQGWWTLDSEATLKEIRDAVPNQKMQQQLLHNMSIFDFGFETQDVVSVFMMQSVKTEWNTKSGDSKQAKVEVNLGGRLMAMNITRKGADSIHIQPDGQPFQVVLRRMKVATSQQNHLDDLVEPMKGDWKINLDRTAEVAKERGMIMSKKEFNTFKDMQFNYDGGKFNVVMGGGKTNQIEWSPWVCEMSDASAKAKPTYMVGASTAGQGAPLSWAFTKGDSIVTMGGMPLVFERAK